MGIEDGFDLLDNAHGLQGLQDIHTDFDQWVCRFNARLTSRSSTDDSCIKNTVSTRHSSSARTQHKAKKSTENTPHPDSESLHKMYDNGLFVAQKIRNPTDTMMEFFNVFKITSNNHTNFDYVLLTLVMENGRKNFHKYIRSKI